MTTIYALSSGRPPAAIAVIRISGPAALTAGTHMAGSLPPARHAGLRTLRGAEGQVLDRALVLCFPGPGSATGEDLVEFHCHGGRAVVAAIEAALAAIGGLRPAQAGEFTRRALTNGRVDLAEAAGLADLLAAETEQQRIAAMAAAEGRVSQVVRGWMDRILRASAQVELLLDYADEDDAVGQAVGDRLMADVHALAAEIVDVASQPSVERLHDGIRIVIAGPPNSGKSTLLNRLSERDAAITSAIAGTTRDRIEVPVTRLGSAYLLVDTAGIRSDPNDAVEVIGINRANQAVAAADILLWTGDEPPPRDDAIWLHMRADEGDRRIIPPGPVLAIARNDEGGLRDLWSLVERVSAVMLPRVDQLPLRTEQQQRCLAAGTILWEASSDPLLLAECLRYSRVELGRILGVDATEAMLDTLFGSFCIGK